MTGQVDTNAGRKDDADKPRLELVHGDFIEEVAKVLTFGANKYEAWNWYRGFRWGRVLGACFRHLFAWARGEKLDPESGLPHLAHAACCIMFLIVFEKRNIGDDDRNIDEVG